MTRARLSIADLYRRESPTSHDLPAARCMHESRRISPFNALTCPPVRNFGPAGPRLLLVPERFPARLALTFSGDATGQKRRVSPPIPPFSTAPLPSTAALGSSKGKNFLACPRRLKALEPAGIRPLQKTRLRHSVGNHGRICRLHDNREALKAAAVEQFDTRCLS